MSCNLLWINSFFTEGFQWGRYFTLFDQCIAHQDDWLNASMFPQVALWENLVLRKSDHISSLFTGMALTFHRGAVNLRRTLLLWDNRSVCHTTLFLCSPTTTTGWEEISLLDSLPAPKWLDGEVEFLFSLWEIWRQISGFSFCPSWMQISGQQAVSFWRRRCRSSRAPWLGWLRMALKVLYPELSSLCPDSAGN